MAHASSFSSRGPARSEPCRIRAERKVGSDSSVLDHLVNAIDNTRDVTEQLKKKSPENLDAQTLFNEDSQEGQYQAEQYKQDLDHECNLPRPHPTASILKGNDASSHMGGWIDEPPKSTDVAIQSELGVRR
jgi:hypothetical protein